MAEENKLQDMIRTSLEGIRGMVDANTVVGTPIATASGTTIIPISKVSVGYASGGTDFGCKTAEKKNFAGGGGTGISVKPVCFLVVDAEGKVELLPLVPAEKTDLERAADIIEQLPDVLARLKTLFRKEKKDDVVEDLAAAAAGAVTGDKE